MIACEDTFAQQRARSSRWTKLLFLRKDQTAIVFLEFLEPAELSEIAVDREVLRVILGLLPRNPPQRKSGHENEWMNM